MPQMQRYTSGLDLEQWQKSYARDGDRWVPRDTYETREAWSEMMHEQRGATVYRGIVWGLLLTAGAVAVLTALFSLIR